MNRQDVAAAARSLRLIVEKTAGEGNSLRDAQLQDRLELAADVLEALAHS
jgi:hypothetical protein